MARIHKATIYFVDFNDVYTGLDQILIDMENNMDVGIEYWEPNSSRQFEWEDDIPVNRSNCPRNEFDKYFEQ